MSDSRSPQSKERTTSHLSFSLKQWLHLLKYNFPFYHELQIHRRFAPPSPVQITDAARKREGGFLQCQRDQPASQPLTEELADVASRRARLESSSRPPQADISVPFMTLLHLDQDSSWPRRQVWLDTHSFQKKGKESGPGRWLSGSDSEHPFNTISLWPLIGCSHCLFVESGSV